MTSELRQQVKEAKLTKEDLKVILLDNFIDEDGNLDLSFLDFRNFDGDVNISYMKVKYDLIQNFQQVEGNLRQDINKVKKSQAIYIKIAKEYKAI